MGILDNLADKAVEKFAKKETIRLPFEQMAEIVKDTFIVGADDAFMRKVEETAKGGNMFTEKKLESTNGRYIFQVGNLQRGVAFGQRKTVWIQDNETNKFYQLDKDSNWKKFYQSVSTAVKMARINGMNSANVTSTTNPINTPPATPAANSTPIINEVNADTSVNSTNANAIENAVNVTETINQTNTNPPTAQIPQYQPPTNVQTPQYQMPPKAQMPQYQNSMVGSQKQASGVLSLVFGILSMVLWLIPLFGLPFSIVGLVTGITAKKKNAQGMAIAGIVLSSIGLFLTIISAVVGAIIGSNLL